MPKYLPECRHHKAACPARRRAFATEAFGTGTAAALPLAFFCACSLCSPSSIYLCVRACPERSSYTTPSDNPPAELVAAELCQSPG